MNRAEFPARGPKHAGTERGAGCWSGDQDTAQSLGLRAEME